MFLRICFSQIPQKWKVLPQSVFKKKRRSQLKAEMKDVRRKQGDQMLW
jgi:hypothetical protein